MTQSYPLHLMNCLTQLNRTQTELSEQFKKLTAQSTTTLVVQQPQQKAIPRQPAAQENVGNNEIGPEFDAAGGYEADFNPPWQAHCQDQPRAPVRQAVRYERPRYGDGDGLLNNIKMSISEFEGRHDPDLYLDWERKLDKIFNCYDFPEIKKVQESYPPIDTWEEIKGFLRGRFIPVHYERELEKKLNKIKQRARSIEEYHKELETALNRVGKEESLNATIIRYIEGMNPDITCEVELRDFTSIDDMVHYASIVERQLREGHHRSHQTSALKRPPWNKAPVQPNFTWPNPPNTVPTSALSRARDVQCHKFQGWGHFQNQCPNRRVLIITDQNELESASEDDEPPKADATPEEDA
ncbi:hypothetical protein C2S53_007947 [Perilla frutescens var. hirtella]|uniref:Retrotransposon gag domain-containing protein n=1 Tax=Perilla frutescens var. hirtella TaxID=608512 RepID=A0AAD4J942_PERFH|nr:hypothetical protein C2S53_007947 [Perilla frutescens var. hirtella]